MTDADTCGESTSDSYVTDLVADVSDATRVANGDSSQSSALRDSACLSTEQDVFRVDNDFRRLQLHLHDAIHASGVYKHCRIPLSSALNISLWRSYLVDYSDSIVCDYLEFGWPVIIWSSGGLFGWLSIE